MGKGGSAPSQPATTTQIQDIPEWERGYVERLLGQAETIAAQPYQAFPGPKIAGFTDDQMQAFNNIQNATGINQNNQANALQQAGYGADSANGVYNAGQGYINQATQYNPLAAVAPYLGAATQYNSASAAQPWLNQAANYTNAAANTATPGGIQAYLSPYTDNVVKGIQDQANLNWNQNIMPGVNDKFIGGGQYASGRNAQVVGQAAGNFQTGLSANVANALETGYNMAGQQAQAQAGILGNAANTALSGAGTASNAQSSQVQNLLNQANVAGTTTQQQAANLQSAGTNLGNLAATQSGAQLTAGKTIGDLGAQSAATNLTQNQALQGIGQQQQQLDQANLNAAQQDWKDQTDWGKTQTEYLNQIIRGLPAPVSTTVSSESTPANMISPLAAIGGGATSALSLVGQATQGGLKEGGMVKGYAAGGMVDDEEEEQLSPLDIAAYADEQPAEEDEESVNVANPLDAISAITNASSDEPASEEMPVVEEAKAPSAMPSRPLDRGDSQQEQLLALARGMLTPTPGGSVAAALGQGLGNMQDLRLKERELQANQHNIDTKTNMELARLGIDKQKADQLDKYHRDLIAAKTGALDPKAEENSKLTGEEYLKAIPALRAANAKAASEGRLTITPFMLKTPFGQQLLTDVMQYDPTYDAANAPARVATAKSFKAGKDAQNITSINTSIGHVAALADAAKKLNNNNFRPANYVQNTVKGAINFPELKDFDSKANAVADELTKTFRGSSGAVHDVKEWRKTINPNMTPEEMDASIGSIMDLLDSRIEALGETYKRGMGKDIDPTALLSPHAQEAYNRIRGIKPEAADVNAPPPNASAASSIQQAIQAERARRANK